MVGPRRPAAPHLALGVILMLLLVAPLPGSQGQAATQLFTPHEDTGHGWTFPTTHAARGTIDDDDADMAVGAIAAATPPVPPPITRAVEITALHIDEIDPAVLRLRLEVADIDPTAIQREQTIQGLGYRFGFHIDGWEYSITGEMRTSCTAPEDTTCQQLAAAGLMYRASFSRYHSETQSSAGLGSPPTRVLADEDAVEVLLPRHLLRDDNGAHPAAGRQVSNLWAFASTSHALYDRWTDDAGDRFALDPAPVLRLTLDSYGSQVLLSTQAPADPDVEAPQPFNSYGTPIGPRLERVDIGTEMPGRVPIHITNVLERKIIVVPTVELLGGGSGHTVRAPEGLEIRAGDTRRIDIIVNGTGPVDPANPLQLSVSARPLGLTSETGDRLDVLVRSVPQLSPDAPHLYLQASEPEAGLWVGDVTIGGFYNGYLSPLQDDPLGTAETVPLASSCVCPATAYWAAVSPQSAPVMLAPEQDGMLHLVVDAPTAGDYTVFATVLYDGMPIGSGGLDAAITAGEHTLDVPLVFGPEDPRLHAGGRFDLDIDARFTNLPTPFALTLDQDAPRVRLQGQSHVALPLQALPAAVLTADHLVVGVGAGYDAYQYVNPGRTTLWNVTVLNQGLENDTVTIAAQADDPAWKLRVAPGTAYRVGPGESITVGILATAPEDAVEEQHVAVNVTASSALENGKGAMLTVRAIVTSGIDIDDIVYVADNETAERVADKERENAPGAAAILLPAVMLAAAAIARRRRP